MKRFMETAKKLGGFVEILRFFCGSLEGVVKWKRALFL